MLIPCIENDLQTVSEPTNGQLRHYVFHSSLAATCFGLTAIISELRFYITKPYSDKTVL